MPSASKLALPHLCIPTDYSLLKTCCVLGGTVLVIWNLKRYWSTYARNKRLQNLISKRRIERDEVIEKIKAELATADEKTLEKRQWIVSLTMKELSGKLQSDELGPVEVLEAFQAAALKAHEKTNCVTQFSLEARKWSEELEKKYKGQGDKPAMYGIPFSVKESIGVQGHDFTTGLAQFLNDPAKEDAAVVARLRQLGAVPFVFTNIPQTCLSFSCSNPIYGLTTNPYDAKRTCGGSSGGEAALIACRGAPFGLGTDLAGSIRVPCHFCGVVGLKPCSARLSVLGSRKAVSGCTTVPASFGPISNDVDTLATFMGEVLKEEFFSMDSNVAPVPFRRDIYDSDKKLTIGYYDFDGFMEAVPACRRAVSTAKRILEEKGHRLVPFRPQGVDDHLVSIAARVLSFDSRYALTRVLRKDIYDPIVGPGYRRSVLPVAIQTLLARIAYMCGETKGGVLAGSIDTTTRQLVNTLASIIAFKSAFNAEWRRRKLDAVICPSSATVAMPHDVLWKVFPAFFYTALYNILDYPAGIVPVTRVTALDEEQVATAYCANECFSKLIQQCNQTGTVGLPVGVQCVAATYGEEVCLRVMKEIEDGVRMRK